MISQEHVRVLDAPRRLRDAEATIYEAKQICRNMLKHGDLTEETDAAIAQIQSALLEYEEAPEI